MIVNNTAETTAAPCHDSLASNSVQLAEDIRRHLAISLGQGESKSSEHALYTALSLALRDSMIGRSVVQRENDLEVGCKQVHYLSMEFLMGRLLSNTVGNLQIDQALGDALNQLGCTLEELLAEEPDAGLGNGGLGRLAACFLDSCATLNLPVTGYGLRYRYGMFEQGIHEGYQTEAPDSWLKRGYPWEIKRPELARRIAFFGHTEKQTDQAGRLHVRLCETEDVMAIPYDIPIPGHQTQRVNVLRLWSAKPYAGFDLHTFNAGEHLDSVTAKNQAEEISMVLYPSDETEAGKLLRLRQQYFLSSASLQDVLASWTGEHGANFSHFAELNCFQLNDTHPICAIPELMRLLMDEHNLEWGQAWSITSHSMAYTNHTLLPEALEQWPLAMFEYLLPRLAEIIIEIDRRFCAAVEARWPDDSARLDRMAIISKGDNPQVRMAYLGIVGSFSVNGVAQLHSGLLKSHLFKDFVELWPGRFNNKTNGVTHRRWLHQCNPGLRDLLLETIGDGWIKDLQQLQDLRPYAEDGHFRSKWAAVHLENKQQLARLVASRCDVVFDPGHLFDVQVKRIHEYKRQLLNVLHVIHLYDRIMRGDVKGMAARCVLIGGKAAPSYAAAKLIIKLINNVAAMVNQDPATEGLLRLAFLPNYGVSAMEVICPAADLSEQISTAGKEASGTGNMKFMMNGALTIGTMDGANVEIHEAVGEEHFFRFGLSTQQVASIRQDYRPEDCISKSEALQNVIALLENNFFSQGEEDIFTPLLEALRSPTDPWVSLADFDSYVAAQQEVADAFSDRENWLRSSILNTACSGIFSSDRTIADYASDIWNIQPEGFKGD